MGYLDDLRDIEQFEKSFKEHDSVGEISKDELESITKMVSEIKPVNSDLRDILNSEASSNSSSSEPFSFIDENLFNSFDMKDLDFSSDDTLEYLDKSQDKINDFVKDMLGRDDSKCKEKKQGVDLKDDCECLSSTTSEKDPCLEKFENRFQLMQQNGDIHGAMFNGQNLVPCTNFDAMFDCQMVGNRVFDYILGSNNFLINSLSRVGLNIG